jgi:hypothetical protein
MLKNGKREKEEKNLSLYKHPKFCIAHDKLVIMATSYMELNNWC